MKAKRIAALRKIADAPSMSIHGVRDILIECLDDIERLMEGERAADKEIKRLQGGNERAERHTKRWQKQYGDLCDELGQLHREAAEAAEAKGNSDG